MHSKATSMARRYKNREFWMLATSIPAHGSSIKDKPPSNKHGGIKLQCTVTEPGISVSGKDYRCLYGLPVFRINVISEVSRLDTPSSTETG